VTDQNARLGFYGGQGTSSDTTTVDGLDTFDHLQQPDFDPVDDLSRFVKRRIVEAELEPRGEVRAAYDQSPAGPMAHRYASHVRRDMVAFRRIAAEYCGVYLEAQAATKPEDALVWQAYLTGTKGSMTAVANRWASHPDFYPGWLIDDGQT
jgi:hypothetical protein